MTRTSQETRAYRDLCGAHELATMLGVSRQRIQQLATHPNFPQPVLELEMGRIWSIAEVHRWARARGRELSHTGSSVSP